MNEHKQTKHVILLLYIFLLGGIVFGGSQINKRTQLQQFYNTHEQNQITDISIYKDLPSKSQKELNKIIAYNLTKQENYEEAIQMITAHDSESYYTLGALKTLQAYNEALSSSLSGLQKARHLINEAFQDFDTAEKIQLNTTLDSYIKQNRQLSEKLGVIINIKTCYGEYSYTIETLQAFSEKLEETKNKLKSEEKEIEKNNTIDSTCKDSLENINKTSQTQVKNLQKLIDNYNKEYKKNLSYNIKEPIACLGSNLSDIDPLVQDSNEGIDEFNTNHDYTINTLKSGERNELKELCKFAKNDSQINEEIDNSLNQLMQQLEDNLEKKGSDQPEQEKTQASGNPEYKSIFEEEELEVLQEIDENNKSLIQQIQELKGEGRYKANTLLDELFNSFYGHTGDFEDLLETEYSGNKR